MRLCRFGQETAPRVGIYDERGIVPLEGAAALAKIAGFAPESTNLLHFLPSGVGFEPASRIAAWVEKNFETLPADLKLDPAKTPLLVPTPEPRKIFLLAGNYAEHIREGGGIAEERQNTFPYVFMKPPTTLTHPGTAIKIPKTAPDAVDWELELGVIIGQTVKAIPEAKALEAVAGYTVINDISQRKYQPNPTRKPRDKDKFFDWLHGKWFDTFCPVGPCILSSDALPDPQVLKMTLKLNGEVRQDGSTGQMIFPVAALVSFISQMVTLEPGDIISTGTPAGVGHTTNTFLKPGDVMTGFIEKIGTLVTPVEAE